MVSISEVTMHDNGLMHYQDGGLQRKVSLVRRRSINTGATVMFNIGRGNILKTN